MPDSNIAIGDNKAVDEPRSAQVMFGLYEPIADPRDERIDDDGFAKS